LQVFKFVGWEVIFPEINLSARTKPGEALKDDTPKKPVKRNGFLHPPSISTSFTHVPKKLLQQLRNYVNRFL
jgi:hypothetical protein